MLLNLNDISFLSQKPKFRLDVPMSQKDPCQKQACEIQKCLQANKYIESRCLNVIQAMRKCCESHARDSICCSGFAKEHKAAEKT